MEAEVGGWDCIAASEFFSVSERCHRDALLPQQQAMAVPACTGGRSRPGSTPVRSARCSHGKVRLHQ